MDTGVLSACMDTGVLSAFMDTLACVCVCALASVCVRPCMCVCVYCAKLGQLTSPMWTYFRGPPSLPCSQPSKGWESEVHANKSADSEIQVVIVPGTKHALGLGPGPWRTGAGKVIQCTGVSHDSFVACGAWLVKQRRKEKR